MPVVFSNNTLQNNNYGVYVCNYTPWWNDAFSSGMITNAVIDNCSILNSTNAGIYMFDCGAPSCPATLSVQGGTSISGGSTGALIAGAQNTLLFPGPSAAANFTGQSTDYFTLAAGQDPAASQPIIRAWQGATTSYLINAEDVMTYSGSNWQNEINDWMYDGGVITYNANGTITLSPPNGSGGTNTQIFSVGGNGDLFIATKAGRPRIPAARRWPPCPPVIPGMSMHNLPT